jgi:flavorubredoxin
MAIRSLAPEVFFIGVNDFDRTVFDALIPVPFGTSYNSYLIKGEKKTAIIYTVEPEKKEEFLRNISDHSIEKLDYIIVNHAEQDHSGLLGMLTNMYPEALIVTNSKCKTFLIDLLVIPDEKFMIVEDNDTLDLGGKTLQFIHAPWVHWPDTMFTFLHEDKILFTTDFFGSHIADTSLFVDDEYKVLDAAKRYYAQIMMPFRSHVKSNLLKVEKLDLNIIAPSHGQLHNNPSLIINAYKAWSSDDVKNEVVIPFVSMHGSTRIMVEYLMDKLVEMNIKVKPFNLEKADLGELAMATVDAATIVLGTPAVILEQHPLATYATSILNILKPKTKFISFIGSFGWGCKVEESIKNNLRNIKAEFITPVLAKGHPKADAFKALDELAETIYQKHKSLEIIR